MFQCLHPNSFAGNGCERESFVVCSAGVPPARKVSYKLSDKKYLYIDIIVLKF